MGGGPLTTKPGDRVQEDHGEQCIITPPSPDNPHNFGPASARDTAVFTCERPGGDPPIGEGAKIATTQKVEEFVHFMTSTQQLRTGPKKTPLHVFILMADEELQVYDEPGLLQAYQKHSDQLVVHHTPYVATKSYQTIMNQLDAVAAKGEWAVAHCTHGMGRSGRVAAGWLVHKYGLSVEEAVEEALESARTARVERMGSPIQLAAWIAESASES